MLEALRTPDTRFENLPDFQFAPHYVEDLQGFEGLRGHYLDEGDPESREIFLCLHGEPSWSYLYRKMIPIFTDAGVRVIAPDLLGFGRSDKPVDDMAYTFDFHRNYLMRFIETLDLENITLVCQDWGGVLGLTLPQDMPGRFKRLLIMNTGIMTGEVSEAFEAWKADIDSDPDVPIAMVMKKNAPGLSDAEAAAYEAPFPSKAYKAGARRFPALVATSTDFPGVETSLAALPFWSEQWQGETFMAIGMLDPMLGPEVMYAMKDLIQGCPEPLELPNAGHFVQEHGEIVAHRALEHFGLSSAPPRRCALQVHAGGSPMKGLIVEGTALTLSDSLPRPTPGPGQVLVQVHAAGLNPSDSDIAAGALDSLFSDSARSVPVRTGLEFAGVVVEGGVSVSPGQAVYGYPEFLGAQKAHQEFVVVDEDYVAPMPKHVSFVEAASLPLAAVTVLVTHRDVAPLEPGGRVLVIGAAGGVGLVHVQVAKHVHGAEVTAVAGPGSGEILTDLGADRVLDYHQTSLADLNERFDVVVDWTTHYRFSEISHLLTDPGRFVPADPFKNSEDFQEGSAAAASTGKLLAVQGSQADLATVTRWVDAGLLKPVVDSVFAFDDHQQAFERLAARAKRGRVVMQMVQSADSHGK